MRMVWGHLKSVNYILVFLCYVTGLLKDGIRFADYVYIAKGRRLETSSSTSGCSTGEAGECHVCWVFLNVLVHAGKNS